MGRYSIFLTNLTFFFIKVISFLDVYAHIHISKSFFFNCSSIHNGGALYFYNSNNFSMVESFFFKNKASKGGVLCSESENNSIKVNAFIEKNYFQENFAILEGGCIKISNDLTRKEAQIISANNFYYKNNATYGNDYASFQIRMEVKILNASNNEIVFGASDNNLVLLSCFSGLSFPFDFSISFLDHFDELVSMDLEK